LLAGAPTLPTLPLCQLYFSLNENQGLIFTRHMIDFIEKIQLAKWQSWQSGKVGGNFGLTSYSRVVYKFIPFLI